jgi:vacuolar-type H+-ATPase subunit H
MPAQMKRRRREGGDASGEQTDAEDEGLRETIHEAVNASVEAARKRGEEERARLLNEAEEEAAEVTAAAEVGLCTSWNAVDQLESAWFPTLEPIKRYL